MSRRLFAFLLSELKIVRVICPHCKAVAEVTVEQLATRFEGDRRCLGCNEFYGIGNGENGPNAIHTLGKAIRDYLTVKANAKFPEIEFVLPDDGDDKLDPRK